MDKKPAMSNTEVTIKGINALQKSLGSTATLRFLSLLHDDATDYVKLSQQLYNEQTIDEIYNRAEKNWK